MQKQPELVWGIDRLDVDRQSDADHHQLRWSASGCGLLRVPYRLIVSLDRDLCAIGIYSINNAPVDVILAGAFGLLGYWLIKHDFEPAPLLLGMVPDR